MTGATIRRYRPADRRAVWLVHDRALRTAWDAYDPEYNRYLRHVERTFLDDDGGEFLVGDVGEPSTSAPPTPAAGSGVVAIGGFQPVGDDPPTVLVAAGHGGGATARVRSVAVDPAWQGEGIGRDLMRALETRARERGFDQVALQSPGALRGTHEFYEGLGYERVGESDGATDGYVWFRREL